VATTSPNEWFGTTTSVTGLLHYQTEANGHLTPLLYVTNLGDCQLLVIRPRHGEEENVVFRTKGQWHWFDCPMQLGTNSVDTPRQNAVLSTLALEERDIIVAVSDGVTDNLWEHEVSKVVLDSVQHWAARGKDEGPTEADVAVAQGSAMVYAAQKLLLAARAVAQDPFAQTPYMEKALEEGLAIEGGTYPTDSDDCGASSNSFRRQDGRYQCCRSPVCAAGVIAKRSFIPPRANLRRQGHSLPDHKPKSHQVGFSATAAG
jgi:protein phosphatase PTC7